MFKWMQRKLPAAGTWRDVCPKVDCVALLGADGRTMLAMPPGTTHHVLMERARDIEMDLDGYTRGFLLTSGMFVDGKEAARYALMTGQVKELKAPPELYDVDLWP